tara:strand:- start:7 stop:273 length:267 start_codon:yes stop_codon:yes gene_type:complete
MYGTRFTLIGLTVTLIGLILLTIWLYTYCGSKPVVDRGTETVESGGSSLFLAGFFMTIIGLFLCFFGFVQSAEHTSRRTSPKLNNKHI